MPIKKHIVKVETGNKITIPKSICSSLGIAEGTPIKIFSNNTGYSFSCEVPLSFENMRLIESYRQEIAELNKTIKILKGEK